MFSVVYIIVYSFRFRFTISIVIDYDLVLDIDINSEVVCDIGEDDVISDRFSNDNKTVIDGI